MLAKPKTVIIGIDGVSYDLMDSLSEKGVMSNFKLLKNRGFFSKLRSSIPPLSSISWSSIITGKNPGEHGIFGFMELDPKTYTLFFPDFTSLKSPCFWQKIADKKHIILNVPSTYPAQPLNGIHVSGFISLDLEGAVYPKKEIDNLKELDYKVDVDSSLAHQSKSLFLENLMAVHKTRVKAFRYFWQKKNWDLFMIVFTGSDRLGHFFWKEYQEEGESYEVILDYFRKIDEVIGEVASQLKENDSLFMLSDHGMAETNGNININYILKEKGFLDLNPEFKSFNQITEKTKAFALEPGRIYIHKKDKYSRGRVEKERELIEELKELFENLEFEDEKVIEKVFLKQEAYKGEHLDQAPDLILLPNKGFRLRANLDKDRIFEKDIFTGDHTLDDAFLMVKGPLQEQVFKNPCVEDFESLIEKSFYG